MDWTEETISRLRGLWQEGLSTAEIGRRMSITKNAVVGKAHRLTLPPRPSPIRKGQASGQVAGETGAQPPMPRAGRVTPFVPRPASLKLAGDMPQATVTPLRPVSPARPNPARPNPARSSPARSSPARSSPARPDPELAPDPRPAAAITQELRGAFVAPVPRAASQPSPRRYGQSCCWPLGDPGTKQFHFCGSEPIPGKPYCSDHAQLAYVKLRDRRDTVA